jgi:hypothetical protein
VLVVMGFAYGSGHRPDPLALLRDPFGGIGRLALQLPFLKVSESMGNHDSKIVDACGVD